MFCALNSFPLLDLRQNGVKLAHNWLVKDLAISPIKMSHDIIRPMRDEEIQKLNCTVMVISGLVFIILIIPIYT